jgi:hypothetical protein
MLTLFDQLTIQNGASIFGRTIPNLLADKFGMINTFIVIVFCTGLSVFGLLWIDSVKGVTIFAIIYGFFSGGGQSWLSFASTAMRLNWNTYDSSIVIVRPYFGHFC